MNTPFTVSAEFEGATVADFEATSRNGGDTVTTGTLNYLVDSAPTTVNTNYPTLSPYGANYITEIKLNMSGTAGNGKANDDGITLTQTFCIGTSACTTADEIVITESIGNDSSTVTYTCSAGTGSGATCGAATGSNASYATFKVNVIEVNVTDVYALSADQNFGGNNTTTTLNNFTDVFTEDELTPEPSSILLLGGGLLGLAALRFRKRKQQA